MVVGMLGLFGINSLINFLNLVVLHWYTYFVPTQFAVFEYECGGNIRPLSVSVNVPDVIDECIILLV